MDELESVEQAIAALEGQRAVLGDEVVATAVAPLVEKRERLRAATTGEQRKLVTVLFGDLVGFTELSGRLDPEDVRSVMGRYFAAWREAVETEGGAVEKYIGDAVMAVFGLYRAREDDPHRAVRAALTMRQSLARLSRQVETQLGVRMHVRVGIDTGEAVVSVLDPRGAAEFAVVGDLVNRAARLQAAAPTDGVLVSSTTGDLVRGAFGLHAVRGLELKGIAAPVDAYLVTTETSAEFWPEVRGVEGVTTRTVGRELELGRLQKLLADVVDDAGWRIVTVVGEAGVGKSRLVHDLEDWMARLPWPVWVLRGRASPSTEDVPNALLRSVFAYRLGVQDTDSPDVVHAKWCSGVAHLLGEGEDGVRAAETVAAWLGFSLGDDEALAALRSDPEALRRRASALVTRLLDRLSESAPIVVLLEDLHWSDSASLDWLEEVGAAAHQHPLLVVATTRPALFERRPGWGESLDLHSRLRLEPLSARESRALLADILQRADVVPDAVAHVVVTAAEGNPFYIEELVKWLIEQGVVETGEETWTVHESALRDLEVPTTLRGVLQARLDALAPSDRDVVDRASVVGRVFWDAAVGRLAASEAAAVLPVVDRLRSREVVFERPRSTFDHTREFSFRHALLRDVAYEGVLRSVRRRYHALAAAWLEDVVASSGRDDEHAGAVAHHHEAAGDHAAAARWYLRAGRHAAGAFANDDALRLLARARALVPADELDLRLEILLTSETVLNRLGRRAEQRELLDELEALPGLDDTDRARIAITEAWWLFNHSDYHDVPAAAALAARHARAAGRPDLEVDALMMEGRSLAFAGDHATARDRLDTALAQARSLGSHAQTGEALRLLAVVVNNQGDSDSSIDLLEQAAAELELGGSEEQKALVAGQLGAVYINIGRLDEGRRWSEEALATFVASGHRLRQATVLGNLASAALDAGRLDEALAYSTDTLRITEEIDDPEGVVSSLSRIGDAHRLTGDVVSSREVLQRGLELGLQHETHYFTSNVLCSLAVLDLEDGLAEEATARSRQAMESAQRSEIPAMEARSSFLCGLARHLAGDPAATQLLADAVDLHGEVGMEADRLECEAALAGALADQGRTDDALALVRDVLDGLDAGRAPGVVRPGQLLVDCHRVLVAAADPRALDVARRATAYLTERAALIQDERMRAGFLSTPLNRRLAALAVPSPTPGPVSQPAAAQD